jgi:sterol desaturase/sphingolipid hydroxylase (fatty acid hydroxylase superfamily)
VVSRAGRGGTVEAMTTTAILTDADEAPPAEGSASPLRRRGLVLAGLVALAVAWLWREQTAPAQPGQSLLPVDADLVLAASIVAMIVVEIVARVVRRRRIDASDSVSSMTIGVGYFAIGAVFGKIVAFGAYLWVFEHLALFDLSWRSPLVWFGYWIVGDFFSYWIHRAEHRIRVLWCSHQVHHSSTDFSFTTAVRMPWTEMLYKPVTGLWAPLLGFPPIMYPVMGALSLMVGQLQHTDLIGRLGPLDRWLMTPANHRVHHASNQPYLDRNFGGHTVVFDRLFGTFQAELAGVAPVYGLTHPTGADTTLAVVAGGFPGLARDLVGTRSARHALALCVAPPT